MPRREVVEFRRRTLLPLDDVLSCLQRYDISRLPENPDKPSRRGKFAETPIGYVHIDISELRLFQGKLNMFLAIDRVSKSTYIECRYDAWKMNGADFLRGVVQAFADLPNTATDHLPGMVGHMSSTASASRTGSSTS